MLSLALLTRRRTAFLCVWLLFLAAAALFSRVDPLHWQPLSGTTAPAAEEATPDSVSPALPLPPAWERARHLARLGVAPWHAAGHLGRGVKVAVLDSGFRGYRAQLGKALPAQIAARSFRLDGDLEARDSQHGILCAEVIHALAPEAELLFANWEPDQPGKFLDAVRWARQQGARVISCSLIMPSWSDGEGGGAVNEELARIVGPGSGQGDVLCFASAGNTAQRHWYGSFRADGAGRHQWRPGHSSNLLTPWGGERVAVELYGRADAPYELKVEDAVSGEQVGHDVMHPETAGAANAGCAVVRFLPQRRHRYRLQLVCRRPGAEAAGGPFHLAVLGGSLEYSTSQGSIPCPADGPGVLAVGAVDGSGRRLFYSSCGPNSRRPKPDLVAEVPFPSLWRDRPFAGTSAAAPQAAALAALWCARNPHWTAAQVKAAMLAAALDLGPAGHDWETGYGRITLP